MAVLNTHAHIHIHTLSLTAFTPDWPRELWQYLLHECLSPVPEGRTRAARGSEEVSTERYSRINRVFFVVKGMKYIYVGKYD